jgi:hypothetical protein
MREERQFVLAGHPDATCEFRHGLDYVRPRHWHRISGYCRTPARAWERAARGMGHSPLLPCD